jgi:hypothetical protein
VTFSGAWGGGDVAEFDLGDIWAEDRERDGDRAIYDADDADEARALFDAEVAHWLNEDVVDLLEDFGYDKHCEHVRRGRLSHFPTEPRWFARTEMRENGFGRRRRQYPPRGTGVDEEYGTAGRNALVELSRGGVVRTTQALSAATYERLVRHGLAERVGPREFRLADTQAARELAARAAQELEACLADSSS